MSQVLIRLLLTAVSIGDARQADPKCSSIGLAPRSGAIDHGSQTRCSRMTRTSLSTCSKSETTLAGSISSNNRGKFSTKTRPLRTSIEWAPAMATILPRYHRPIWPHSSTTNPCPPPSKQIVSITINKTTIVVERPPSCPKAT